MTQLLLQIADETKANKLLEFLKTLNYLSVHELSEENMIIPEVTKELMHERLQLAKEEDFRDWEEIKRKFDLK